MNTLSKIDVRMESVRIAAQLKDAAVGNVVETAQEIAGYILAGAELPEVGTAYYKSLLEGFSASLSRNGDTPTEGKEARP